MFEYKQGDRVFAFSYQQVRGVYRDMCAMTDDQFVENLPHAIHLACYICFIKETPTDVCLNDVGIVHQLAHAIAFGMDDPSVDITELRKQFKKELKLS